MSSAAWDGSTTKQGKIVGIKVGGALSGVTTPGGTTNSAYGGFVCEVVDDAGNFVTGIGVEFGNGTQTTYKKLSTLGLVTGTQYRPAVGDILSATSSAIVVIKTQL